MALNKTGKDELLLNAAPSLAQPTMVQLGGVEYNLRKQTKSWKVEKPNQHQQYKAFQPVSVDDIQKKSAASHRRSYYVQEKQREVGMLQGGVSPRLSGEETRRTLAGGGYGQPPPGLQVKLPDINLGGSFGGGLGGGYGGGGHQQTRKM